MVKANVMQLLHSNINNLQFQINSVYWLISKLGRKWVKLGAATIISC